MGVTVTKVGLGTGILDAAGLSDVKKEEADSRCVGRAVVSDWSAPTGPRR
jgi:hypothetical protein